MKNIHHFKNFLVASFRKKHFDYQQYWEERYRNKGTSGAGSYGILVKDKADFLNQFVEQNGIKSVIEFGCGDGNQLSLANYLQYLGFDVSISALEICTKKYGNDKGKSFLLYEPNYFSNKGFLKADLVICIDVLYHITDEKDFYKTLHDIFSCSRNFVVLYTSLHQETSAQHVLHREILPILQSINDFRIVEIINQEHRELSSAQFIILQLITSEE